MATLANEGKPNTDTGALEKAALKQAEELVINKLEQKVGAEFQKIAGTAQQAAAVPQFAEQFVDPDQLITRDNQPVIPGFEVNKPSLDAAIEEPVYATPKKKIDWENNDNVAAYTCADIFVGSYTIKSFESFQLSQSVTAHHTFELVIGHDALLSQDGSRVVDDQWLSNACKLMGEKISIGFYYHIWPDQKRWFEGIVTNVSYRRCTYGFGEIVISGGSPTLLLDAAPHTQSFTGNTVQSIATEILNQAGLDTKGVKSRFGRPLPYSCQYNETHYNYLARLAAGYGDWFWYDGVDLYFGKPEFFKPDVKLVLGRDVYEMEAGMNARHTQTEHYGYNSSDHEALRHDTFEITGVDYFGEKALTTSEQMFKTPTRQVAPVRAIDAKEVTASQKSMATAKATELFNIKGRSTNPYLFPGCVVILEIRDVSTNKKTHYATLIITELRQILSYDGSYDCEFVGIPQKTENLPFHQFTMPIAEPQLATVTDNKDSQGRVKVQFPWQEDPTDFIRVLSPDAGSSDKVGTNRGFVSIPEIGDQVLVGFMHNNPDRPFVMGGMFHGKIGGGGGEGNNVKSLTSKSGHTVRLDDGGGILVKDKNGNEVHVDGAGNITATSSATNESIVGATKGNPNGVAKIKMDSGGNITVEGNTGITFKTGESSITMLSTGVIMVKGKIIGVAGENIGVSGTKSIVITSPDNNLTGKSTKLNGGDVFIN
ncbi:type VI secretion system Vgr family protein [Taibaiella soli]|uniref:Vgr family protein n=1 Tax=Taibaiella soli TaxID=1649169 RepID=A0A2W2B5K6_9BACT|nr:phage baseplate assembly protein V [Taibaiella soli]PZF71267.1 Vgr family protein [Taibaiella soli]